VPHTRAGAGVSRGVAWRGARARARARWPMRGGVGAVAVAQPQRRTRCIYFGAGASDLGLFLVIGRPRDLIRSPSILFSPFTAALGTLFLAFPTRSALTP
jgi:hypothetical protein